MLCAFVGRLSERCGEFAQPASSPKRGQPAFFMILFYMVLSPISSSTSFETTSILFACASHADSLTKACVMHVYKIVVENSEMGYEG